MDDLTKPWFQSQTIWGGVATVGASLGAAYAGFQAHDMNVVAASLLAAFGGLQAIIGRFKASKPIGPKTVTAPAKA